MKSSQNLSFTFPASSYCETYVITIPTVRLPIKIFIIINPLFTCLTSKILPIHFLATSIMKSAIPKPFPMKTIQSSSSIPIISQHDAPLHLISCTRRTLAFLHVNVSTFSLVRSFIVLTFKLPNLNFSSVICEF